MTKVEFAKTLNSDWFKVKVKLEPFPVWIMSPTSMDSPLEICLRGAFSDFFTKTFPNTIVATPFSCEKRGGK